MFLIFKVILWVALAMRIENMFYVTPIPKFKCRHVRRSCRPRTIKVPADDSFFKLRFDKLFDIISNMWRRKLFSLVVWTILWRVHHSFNQSRENIIQQFFKFILGPTVCALFQLFCWLEKNRLFLFTNFTKIVKQYRIYHFIFIFIILTHFGFFC